MKNLVLSALLFAGLTQAAGCIITSDDTPIGDGTGDVDVSWRLLSSDAAGNPVATGCPAGGDTVQILVQRGNDTPFTDTHFCADGGGLATRLLPGTYFVWIQITDTNGVTKFAESGAQEITVVDGGVTPVTIDIFTDRAFFSGSWTLTRGGPVTCAQAGVTSMSVLATVSGGADAFDDDNVACTEGEAGKTAFTNLPVPLGNYTVVVAALDNTGASLGNAPARPNQVLDFGNKWQDLGDLTIPVQ